MASRFKRLIRPLAMLLLLRALVPVGYMLAFAPGAGLASVAYVFCPTQNAELNLSLLETGHGNAHHEHHVDGHTPSPGPGSHASVALDGDCSLWIGGLAEQVALTPSFNYVLSRQQSPASQATTSPAGDVWPAPLPRGPPPVS